MNEIYASHHRGLITWLCIVRRDLHIRTCVNRDVARKIAELVRVVVDRPVLAYCDYADNFWCFISCDMQHWSLDIESRPCHNCLRACHRDEKYCLKCLETVSEPCECMERFGHSIKASCFDKLRSRIDLPIANDTNLSQNILPRLNKKQRVS